MSESAASEHCYTPSWCKCPDEPKCQLCKQGRCPVEPETSAATESPYPHPNCGGKVRLLRVDPIDGRRVATWRCEGCGATVTTEVDDA